jgi:hypothetical protein
MYSFDYSEIPKVFFTPHYLGRSRLMWFRVIFASNIIIAPMLS